MANRPKNVTLTLINNNQTGFLKDKNIGENIRLTDIDGVINHKAAHSIPGLFTTFFFLILKAFDIVEWHFKTFGTSFIGLINCVITI